MPTPIARTLAVACLALAASAHRGSACTSASCTCPHSEATLNSTPIAAKPLDFAFDFSRYAPMEFATGWGRVRRDRGPTSRQSEARLLDQLTAREAEIAASLPVGRSLSEHAAPTTRREPLNMAFDFSGKFQQYLGRFRVEGYLSLPRINHAKQQLREEELLGQLASCEQLIARELAGRSETVPPPLKDAVSRVPGLIDAVAPRDAYAAIVEILERETGNSLDICDASSPHRVLDELDDAAYAPWADRPGRSGVAPPSDDPTSLAWRYDPSPLDMTFGYSRHSLEFAGATAEFRCRCAEAAQLPGHPAMNADQILAELDVAEARIAADLEFPLPAPLPEPGREFRQRFEDQPWNFGWSGMTIAQQSGVAARFHTVTGVAMRFHDEQPFEIGGTFIR